jgi:hypothetical protein
MDCILSQTVRLSTLLRALDRAAFLGARDRETIRAGDMGIRAATACTYYYLRQHGL